MATESYIRAQILQLFQTNPNIHMNVSLSTKIGFGKRACKNFKRLSAHFSN
jgi:hypothetical protein